MPLHIHYSLVPKKWQEGRRGVLPGKPPIIHFKWPVQRCTKLRDGEQGVGRGIQVMYFHNDIKSTGSRGSSLHNLTQTAAWSGSPHPHSYSILEMDPQGHSVPLTPILHV